MSSDWGMAGCFLASIYRVRHSVEYGDMGSLGHNRVEWA